MDKVPRKIKSINDRVTILALSMSTHADGTFIKFRKYSLSGFQVIERTRFLLSTKFQGK